MNRGKYKKLYYVPGLVSLILVPLLLVLFGKEELQHLNERAIEVNVWDPDTQEYFSLPEIDYKQVTLTGDKSKDPPAIEQAKLFIRKMYEKEDTLAGVHFTFQNAVTFGTFVDILNFLEKTRVTHFVVDKDNIWVLKYPKSNVLLCGVVMMDTPYDPYNYMSLSEKIEHHLSPYRSGALALWPALTLLLLLAILSLWQLVCKRSIHELTSSYFRKLKN